MLRCSTISVRLLGMPFLLGRMRRSILGISLKEATFARRGFHASDVNAQQRLEEIGRVFLQGYHAALEDDMPKSLARRLNEFDLELRGLAFEGAAMGLALLDFLTPWRRDRWVSFASGPGESHIYMMHVGRGWVLARFRQGIGSTVEQLDPVLRWLVVDGYGFHQGYFNWRDYVVKKTIPNRILGYGLRVFDQGLGRSLWFINGADVARITETIAAFHPSRHGDLWSGVGLACAYAGGVDRGALEWLRAAAGPYRPHLAQGAAFAAKARQRAGNPAPHTEVACYILCGMSADAAASMTDNALEGLPRHSPEPAYEVWRRRIQSSFSVEGLA